MTVGWNNRRKVGCSATWTGKYDALHYIKPTTRYTNTISSYYTQQPAYSCKPTKQPLCAYTRTVPTTKLRNKFTQNQPFHEFADNGPYSGYISVTYQTKQRRKMNRNRTLCHAQYQRQCHSLYSEKSFCAKYIAVFLHIRLFALWYKIKQ